MLTITAVENMSGMVTLETSSQFTTQTNVGIVVPEQQNMTIYPNPAKDELRVTFTEGIGNVESVRIYNSSGHELLLNKISSGSNTHYLNVSGFPAGVYILRVTGLKKTVSERFIILR
jgi:hypothetical protein